MQIVHYAFLPINTDDNDKLYLGSGWVLAIGTSVAQGF